MVKLFKMQILTLNGLLRLVEEKKEIQEIQYKVYFK